MGRINVFSWSETNKPNISQFTWVMRNSENPEAAALRVAPILASKPKYHKALFFAYSLLNAFDRTDVVNLFANGPFIEGDIEWYTKFFTALKSTGVRPDWIFTDEENGVSVWQLFYGLDCGNERVSLISSLYENHTIYAKMSPAVKAFKPVDYKCHNVGRLAYMAFNEWAAHIRTEALKDAIYRPFLSVYGPPCPFSNYGDMHVYVPHLGSIVDNNGWPIYNSIVEKWSSPCMYLWPGQLEAQYNKAPLWNSFIRCLNYVLSCMNKTAYVIPWISEANWTYGVGVAEPEKVRIWLWKEMLKHMRIAGIRHILYWNPSADENLNSILSNYLPELENTKYVRKHRELVLFNSDYVETDYYWTDYKDFLAQRK